MITIIDYGVGNLGSLGNLFDRIAVPYVITADPNRAAQAEALLLPGVGAAGEGMDNLRARKLDGVLKRKISDGTPFLGICLGMQLLFDRSDESDAICLGILPGTVRKFTPPQKVPQIGWNQVRYKTAPATNDLWRGIPQDSEYYFVNSYYCVPSDASITIGTTDYGIRFPSVIASNTIVATQFHPEKSSNAGVRFIKNFMEAYL